jgi:hypothetical protein
MRRTAFLFLMLSAVQLSASIVHFPLELDKSSNVIFQVDAPDAAKVTLAGSFNNWDKDKQPLTRDETGTWSCSIRFPAGTHEYKFVLNDQDWQPGENQKFELQERDGQLFLTGGKGFAAWFDRKSNLAASDRIMLGLLYRYSLAADAGNTPAGGSLKENRHIIELYPKIFINNNVYLESVLQADYPYQSIPSLFRARLECRMDNFSLTVFNNDRAFFLRDALKSLKSFDYASGYGVYRLPVDLYNADIPEERSGYNFSGIRAALKWGKTGVDAVFMKPMFGNFDLSAAEIFTKFSGIEIRAFGLLQKGLSDGNNYPVPDSTGWFNSPLGSGRLQVNPTNANSYIPENSAYSVLKAAGQVSVETGPFLKLFGEYAWRVKQGGYYIQSLQSDGGELPSNVPDYGQKIFKIVNIYNSSYNAQEFILGLQPSVKNVFNSEFAWKHEDISYGPSFLVNVKPSVETFYGLLTSGSSRAAGRSSVNLIVSCAIADPLQTSVDYGMGFDENDFYNRPLQGCFEKWTVGGSGRIAGERFILGCEAWYHAYTQKDIYFGQAGQWISSTFSSTILATVALVKGLDVEAGFRYKVYDFSERIEQNLFMTFRNDYLDPYAGLSWSPLAHIVLKIGWGIEPVNDEARKDGFNYLLNSFAVSGWPFFADAEKRMSSFSMISFKGEILF